jgi:hypothetical protein
VKGNVEKSPLKKVSVQDLGRAVFCAKLQISLWRYFSLARAGFPSLLRPHPPPLPTIGTGILRQLAEKRSANAQATAAGDFGEEIKTLFLII